MIILIIFFAIMSLVAGVIGFGGIALAFAGIAKILFYIFLVMLLISIVKYIL